MPTTRSGESARTIDMVPQCSFGASGRRGRQLDGALVVLRGGVCFDARLEVVLHALSGALDLGEEDVGEEADDEDHHRERREAHELARA